MIGDQFPPQNVLHTLIQALRLEQERAYNNRSVVGGLDKLLERWGLELTSQARDLTLPAHPYALMSLEQRRDWIAQALVTVEETEGIAFGSNSQSVSNRRLQSSKVPRNNPESFAKLDDPVSSLRSVTRSVPQKLDRLGIQTIRDLVYHFPRRYSEVRKVAQLRPTEEEQAVLVTLWSANLTTLGKRLKATEAVVGDETGNIRVVWFNQPYLANRLKANTRLLLSGKVGVYRGVLGFESPDFETVEAGISGPKPGHLLPIYPSTEGLTQRIIRRAMTEAMDGTLSQVEDAVPGSVLDRLELLHLTTALAQAHFPHGWDHQEAARRRLAFDELLMLQLWALANRKEWRVAGSGVSLDTDTKLVDLFLASLPFSLTTAQQRVLGEVISDMKQTIPMNRLLHGDVGSGKTVVAMAALLMAASHGYQGALMAPTEILAEQHFFTITNLLKGIGSPKEKNRMAVFQLGRESKPLSVGLLIGSMSRKQKDETYVQLAEGKLDIIVGTQALIQEEVKIPRLALAVVDEQHRFGVMQRSSLRQRTAGHRPHILVMSATPIPRTLTLTLYGDLDVSVIDGLPPGRQPIRTRWVRPRHRRQTAYDFVRRQVEEGRQAFVICPLIEESDVLQVRAATEEFERLSMYEYPDLRIGLLHGRMPSKEKVQIMDDFRRGDLDILVSTPVVEVGVDVPNATVMLVEGADRFGLAQLHQFRGRVGRGQFPSYCLLLAEEPSSIGEERLSLVERISDGFELAEEDLKMRGPGEYTGVRQSGTPDLRMANISDQPLLQLARREATIILENDPDLHGPEYALLKLALDRKRQEIVTEIS